MQVVSGENQERSERGGKPMGKVRQDGLPRQVSKTDISLKEVY